MYTRWPILYLTLLHIQGVNLHKRSDARTAYMLVGSVQHAQLDQNSGHYTAFVNS